MSSAPLYTPDEASSVLALPCRQVLYGGYQVTYPGSCRAGPGSVVRLLPVRRVEGQVLHPLEIRRDQWETGVVPVLEDETWWPGNPLNRELPESEYLERLGDALRASFIASGWGPA